MGNNPKGWEQLIDLVIAEKTPDKTRMHALWAMLGTGFVDPLVQNYLIDHKAAPYRAWGVRAGMRTVGPDTTFPANATSPESGISSPAISLNVVVLPHPEGPRSAKTSPG